MIFKRRDFLRTSLGSLFIASLPSMALAKSAPYINTDGVGLTMGMIAHGPFLSLQHRFMYTKPDLPTFFVNFAVVKIGEAKYDFDQSSFLIQNLYNAEEFMRRLGYKFWICTEDVLKLERPINDKEFRVTAKKFGDAFDKFRNK